MMDKKFFLLIILFFSGAHGGAFGLRVLGKGVAKSQFIVTEYEEKKQKLDRLKKEYADLESSEKEFNDDVAAKLVALANDEELVRSRRDNVSVLDVDFINKQEAIINDTRQLLNELPQLRKQEIYHLRKSIDTLERYINNPVFSDLRVADKASYQFSEFQVLSQQSLSVQEELFRYKDEKKRLEDELASNIVQLGKVDQELKQKEKEQEKFLPSREKNFAEDLRQKSDLIDRETILLKTKKRYLEEKAVALQYELDQVNLQLFVSKIKSEVFKKDLDKVDRKLWVNEADIQALKSALDEKRQQILKRQEQSLKELAALTARRDELQKNFDDTDNALSDPIKDVLRLSEWLIDPKTVGDELLFYKVALLNDELQTVERNIALLESSQALNRVSVLSDELQLEAMKAWLNVSQRKLVHDEEDRKSRLKLFIAKKSEINRELEDYKNKESLVSNLMSVETRALNNIKQRIETFNAEKDSFIKVHGEAAYKVVLEQLQKSQEEVNMQLNLNGQIIKVYSNITSLLGDMKRQADMLSRKLEGIGGIWQRSAGAITWDGIKSTIPDLKFFGEDLINILSQASLSEALIWVKQVFGDPVGILNVIFALLLLVALYFLLVISVPLLVKLLGKMQRKNGWQFLVSSLTTILSFINMHLSGLFIWSILFFMVRYDVVIDFGVRAKVLFYLLFIPYLCYISRLFINYFLSENGKFMSEAFRARFSWVFQFFMYSTIIILFFREAFIITTYGHSELPTILLAIYSIITRASLVFLIMTKELILDALPNRGKIWLFLKDQIDQYYSIFLVIIIAFIIMSDPFVGYSRLVASVLRGSLWTIILIAAFWWLQNILKRYSSGLFFVSAGDGVKERFSYGKTWYALFIVVSFAFLIAGIMFLFARVWGYPVSVEYIANFFNIEIMKLSSDIPGETIQVTIWSIVKLIAFLFGGFFVATMFNRYVLERIYNLLQVDAGVQNTISRITSYVIVLIILIVGLTNIGLGMWVPYALGAMVVGIAFAIKGPVDDFVSYFIILVERFIKIGDYIRLNDVTSELSGVVRKITPRSVILRKKNSYYIIVPNSKITRSFVLNWNYTRGYFAFEDIRITVAYSCDPMKVKDVLLKILDDHASILKNPVPVVRINNFSLSGYDFMIRAYLSSSNVLNQWDIRSDVRFAIAREFKKAHLKLAVPVRDVILEKAKASEN